MKHKLLGILIGLSLVASLAVAQDWYQATGKPVQRSLLNSADLRTEFASIETGIADKLPALTGNADKVVVVNSDATALTVAETGIAITAGGTGGTTAVSARSSLGLAIGTNVQAFDADLSTIAGLSKSDGAFIVGDGSNWVAESGVTARASLGANDAANLTTGALPDARLSANVPLLSADNVFTGSFQSVSATGPHFYLQETDAGVDEKIWLFESLSGTLRVGATTADGFAGTTVASGITMMRSGTTISKITLGATDVEINAPLTLGTDLSVANGGTGASTLTGLLQGNGTSAITGGATISNSDWSGTDLAVSNGGTGASTAAGAATALGVGTGDSPHFTAVNIGNSADTTLSRDAAGKLAVEGRAILAHDDSSYTSARIIVTSTTPGDTSGMSNGDIKLVY